MRQVIKLSKRHLRNKTNLYSGIVEILMKNLTWLLYIAIITVTGLLIAFTSYTTESVKTTATNKVTATATTESVKKTPCGCCAKRYALRQERIKQARERKQAREQAENISAP